MSEIKLPEGWDDSRLRRVSSHYEKQTKEDALLEDEAGVQSTETVRNVPHDLVPEVRELIAKATGNRSHPEMNELQDRRFVVVSG